MTSLKTNIFRYLLAHSHRIIKSLSERLRLGKCTIRVIKILAIFSEHGTLQDQSCFLFIIEMSPMV